MENKSFGAWDDEHAWAEPYFILFVYLLVCSKGQNHGNTVLLSLVGNELWEKEEKKHVIKSY